MNDKNMAVLVNIIGAVESGGQIYGNRRYDAYAGPYTNSNKEVTCTLGWVLGKKENWRLSVPNRKFIDLLCTASK